MKRKILKTLTVVVGVTALAVLSCSIFYDEDIESLPAEARADLIVIEKSRHLMTLHEKGRVLRSYRVSLGRGGLARKEREGDNRTPEGLYKIDGRNPRSAFHLSLRISYPDRKDIARAKIKGEDPGGSIMIHGLRNGMGWMKTLHRHIDWTQGCIAVTNKEIEEIWHVVPDHTPVEIKP